MDTKRKAPTGATVEALAEGSTVGTDATSIDKVNTDGNKYQGTIAPLLGIGRANAVTADTLRDFLGFSEARMVTHLIEDERAVGIPICASQQGYYLPADANELAAYIRSYDRRCATMARTRRGLEYAAAQMASQEVIDT